MKKHKRMKDKSKVIVGPERKGRVRGREFGVIGKKGNLEYVVEVDHLREAPPGKGESYITQKDDGPVQIHRTKQDVARRYPRISAKLPKLR